MKTSTVLLIVVGVMLWQSGALFGVGPQQAQQPTVRPPPEPIKATNPGGDTYSQILATITAVADAVKSGIDASSQRS